MKKEIPWELIISDLKQDISDADKKHLEEWVSIDENRKVYEELRGVWEKVRAKVINYTPDVDFYWKELMLSGHGCRIRLSVIITSRVHGGCVTVLSCV